MAENRLGNLLLAAMTLAVLLAGGCGKNAATQKAEKGDKALEQFLDAWSRGEPAEKFADPNGPIQGSDPDWKAGYRLLSFLSGEAKHNPETSDQVRCRVSLFLQDSKGKKVNKEVVYEVQLGEKSVIRRASP